MDQFLVNPTMSYVVDPETGKLLTAQEWKDKAGDQVESAQFVAIVPADGSPAFCSPKKSLGEMNWKKAMAAAESYKTQGKGWSLPTCKQGIDIRDARSAGLDQLLELIGGEGLNDWYWTRQPWIPHGTSLEEYRKIVGAWSSSRCVAGYAWFFSGAYGYSCNAMSTANRALPVLLLDANAAGASA